LLVLFSKYNSNDEAGQVARKGQKRYAYRILLGKPESKRLLGRPRRRWVDNIKMGLRETEWDGMY
jgi:hypothetical protein